MIQTRIKYGMSVGKFGEITKGLMMAALSSLRVQTRK